VFFLLSLLGKIIIFRAVVESPAVKIETIMFRFAVIFWLSALCAGCQSAQHNQVPRKTAAPQRVSEIMKRYFANAVSLVKPDTSEAPPNKTKMSVFAAAAQRQQFNVMPVVQNSGNPLYKAGSIFPAPQLLDNQLLDNTVLPAATAAAIPLENLSPLSETAEDSKNRKSQNRKQNSDSVTEDAGEEQDEEYAEAKRPKKIKRKIEFEPEEEETATEIVRHPAPLPRHTHTPPLPAPEMQPAAQPQYPQLAQLHPNQQSPNAPQIIQANYAAPIANNYAANSYAVTNGTQGYGAGDWQTSLKAAAEQLRYAIDHTPKGKTEQNEMRLRLIEAVLGNKGEAAKPMSSTDKTVNEFIGHQVLGLSALLEEPVGVSPHSNTRYITAAYRLREGLAELSKLCPVKLKTVVLVKDWIEFGLYMPRNEEYKPGESFTVYMELDYPAIRRTADGYNICVALSYELRDASANVVAAQEAVKPTLTTLSRKQDFCVELKGQIPKTLKPGTYQLRISLSDLNSDTLQYTEEQIPLKVAPATEIPE
jgi:hypothetical protein